MRESTLYLYLVII